MQDQIFFFSPDITVFSLSQALQQVKVKIELHLQYHFTTTERALMATLNLMYNRHNITAHNQTVRWTEINSVVNSKFRITAVLKWLQAEGPQRTRGCDN